MPKKPAASLQVVDIARTFAILPVLCMHLLYSGGIKPPLNAWEKGFWLCLSRNGVYGVFLFFVVSGFLITRMVSSTSPNLFRPDIRNFYVRRLGRIFPLLSLTVLFGAFMVYFEGGSSLAYRYCFKYSSFVFGPAFWLSLLTFSFNWYRIFNDQITPSFGLHWDILWSLSIEEQFYFFYPLVLTWIKNEGRFMRFLFIIILLSPISSIVSYTLRPCSFLVFMNSFAAFGSIALGALLHILSQRYGSIFRERKLICGGLCVSGFFIAGSIYFTTSIRQPIDCIYGPFTFSLGIFLFLFGALQLDFFEAKGLRFLSWPGKVSYGAYLIHPTVLFFLSPFLAGVNASLCFFVFIPLVIGVAWISYVFYELPANSWVRKTFGRAGRSPAAA